MHRIPLLLLSAAACQAEHDLITTVDPADVDTQLDSGLVDPGTEVEPLCDCPNGFAPRPDDDGCVQYVETTPTLVEGDYRVCPLADLNVYGNLGARFPAGTTDTQSFWVGETTNPSRLNTVGVWACAEGSDQSTGSAPLSEWIGFSTCFELDEAGLYIIGTGGDNQTRLSLDGQTVRVSASSSTSEFNYWWLLPVTLSSGTHIVEMEGRNDGSQAGFGAEIYGPFPIDTPQDDATLASLDYAGNIAWSTVDVIGGTFQLGENSGLSCPDGSAVDTCDDEPICVEELSADCL